MDERAHPDPILMRCGFTSPEHVRHAIRHNRDWVAEELTDILCDKVQRSFYSDRINLVYVVKTLPVEIQPLVYRYAESYAKTISKTG